MNLLAIDTSTELATVTLAVNGALMSENQDAMRQHAQFLLPMIERLMASAAISFNALDGIVFGRGPGSFTGLRIACSIAKGLAYAHDLPLYPVSTLAAIANEAYVTEDLDVNEADVLAVIDARMEQVYWTHVTNGAFNSLEHVSCPEDVGFTSNKPLLLAGVGFDAYLPKFSEKLQAAIIKRSTIYPNAGAMIRLVEGGEIKAVSAAEALPAYVRNNVTHGAARGDTNG